MQVQDGGSLILPPFLRFSLLCPSGVQKKARLDTRLSKNIPQGLKSALKTKHLRHD
jgi:hypothetical protein